MFHIFILKGRESMKRICAGLLALLLCLTALSVTALASDTTLDIRYVPITEDGFVADTLDGVDALDWRILLEADFLVNMIEEGMKAEAIQCGREKIFRTEMGLRLMERLTKKA